MDYDAEGTAEQSIDLKLKDGDKGDQVTKNGGGRQTGRKSVSNCGSVEISELGVNRADDPDAEADKLLVECWKNFKEQTQTTKYFGCSFYHGRKETGKLSWVSC